MEYNCTNCSQTIAGTFCNHCGQKKYHRIDRKYIWDEAQYMFLHTNKGFLYSVKNIIKNPGKTARGFIDGKRVNHYKPLLLAFVLSGISAFISFKIIKLNDVMLAHYSAKHANSALMRDYMAFTSSYNSIIMLLAIPFLAIFTWLVFRKWGNNYYEHIIMNAYIFSFYTIVSIIIVCPLLLLLKSNVPAFVTVSMASLLIIPLILVWFYKGFYKEKPLKNIIGKVIVILVLILLVYLLLAMIAGVVLVMVKGPAALKYMQAPK